MDILFVKWFHFRNRIKISFLTLKHVRSALSNDKLASSVSMEYAAFFSSIRANNLLHDGDVAKV